MAKIRYISESADETYPQWEKETLRDVMKRACDLMALHIHSSNEFVTITVVQDEVTLLTLVTD